MEDHARAERESNTCGLNFDPNTEKLCHLGSSVLKMGMIILLCVTEVLEIYAFLRHTVAKKKGTMLAPREAPQ